MKRHQNDATDTTDSHHSSHHSHSHSHAYNPKLFAHLMQQFQISAETHASLASFHSHITATAVNGVRTTLPHKIIALTQILQVARAEAAPKLTRV